jgi:hypothetical protein
MGRLVEEAPRRQAGTSRVLFADAVAASASKYDGARFTGLLSADELCVDVAQTSAPVAAQAQRRSRPAARVIRFTFSTLLRCTGFRLVLRRGEGCSNSEKIVEK